PRRLGPAPVRAPARAPVRPLARATKAAARARAEEKVQPRRREAQRRTMRPRQLAVVLVVAALGGLLLNAVSMERDAQTSAFGLRRTAALAVLQPLAAFSHALGLDRPRAALAGLAGHDDSGSPGGGSHDIADGSPQTGGTLLPVAAVAAAATTASPAHRSASADRVIAARVPTRADPLRVWVGGDSVAGFFGFGLDDLAAATGTVAAHSHYQISTGLSRPDYYDWPAHLEADMRAYNPEVVILLVGANDDQPLAVGNQVDDFGSAGWKAEYARRVGAVMDQILAEHRMVVWVGQPVMRAADFDAHMQLENAIYRSEAARRPGVVFFDSRPVLSDGGGGYRPYLPDGSGGVSLMRAGDGIHLTPAGGRRLARAVLDAVLTELASRGETFTVSGVR
ncbi:MAG TPA: DUF459 domain-containing protein, partial [Candidatus Dormibacteraeota bacterium]